MGTPFFTPFFLLGGDSILVAGSLKQVGVFNLKGEKLEEVKLQQILDELAKMENGDFFHLLSIVPGRHKRFLGFKTDWKGRSRQLIKVDVPNNQLTELDLPAVEKLEDYQVEYANWDDMGFFKSEIFLQVEGKK